MEAVVPEVEEFLLDGVERGWREPGGRQDGAAVLLGDTEEEVAATEVVEIVGEGAEARPISPRWAAVSGLANIGVAWPEARSEMVGILTAQLEEQAVWDAGVNGVIVDALIQLEAVESAGAIERAFQAKRVDETITGDWDDVQVELGLKDAPAPVPGSIGLYGSVPVRREGPKVGRNDPCPCGSGENFKKCCGE